jgi:hypothetical protein
MRISSPVIAHTGEIRRQKRPRCRENHSSETVYFRACESDFDPNQPKGMIQSHPETE